MWWVEVAALPALPAPLGLRCHSRPSCGGTVLVSVRRLPSPHPLFSREFGCSPARQSEELLPAGGSTPACPGPACCPFPWLSPARYFNKKLLFLQLAKPLLVQGEPEGPELPIGAWGRRRERRSLEQVASLLAHGEELSHPRHAARAQVAGSSSVPWAHDCPVATGGGWQDVARLGRAPRALLQLPWGIQAALQEQRVPRCKALKSSPRISEASVQFAS